jgi:hypothetical protein
MAVVMRYMTRADLDLSWLVDVVTATIALAIPLLLGSGYELLRRPVSKWLRRRAR